ncbi:hypothetical protein [Neisseria elongata]
MSNISDKIAVKAACTCTSSSASSHTLPYSANDGTPPAAHLCHASHTWPPGCAECRGRKCQSARSPQPRTLACECAFLFNVLFALVTHHLKGEFAYRRQTALLFLPLILLVIYIFYYFGAF